MRPGATLFAANFFLIVTRSSLFFDFLVFLANSCLLGVHTHPPPSTGGVRPGCFERRRAIANRWDTVARLRPTLRRREPSALGRKVPSAGAEWGALCGTGVPSTVERHPTQPEAEAHHPPCLLPQCPLPRGGGAGHCVGIGGSFASRVAAEPCAPCSRKPARGRTHTADRRSSSGL